MNKYGDYIAAFCVLVFLSMSFEDKTNEDVLETRLGKNLLKKGLVALIFTYAFATVIAVTFYFLFWK